MLDKLFNRDTPEREDGFVPVARRTELAEGQLKRVTVKGQSVVLSVLLEEEGAVAATNKVVAFSSICPHALGDLSQGWLVKDEIDCPLHYYRFNIRSGECVYPRGGPRLRMYPVSVEGNTVLVKVEKPKWMDASIDADER
jgi:nitrite reductase/ring-hydroxylating ferredoxin subunit